MKTNYMYNRPLYSNYYYGKKGYIEIITNNNNHLFLYFDKDKHMKFTKDIKFASKFTSKPKNFIGYEKYIKKIYSDAKVIYNEDVVLKSKY